MYVVTANEMQQMDRQTIDAFGIPGRVLMENAGRGATTFFLDTIHRHHPGDVGVVAGRGNNGGDGLVMARYLHQLGIRTTVFLLSNRDRVQGDAAANLKLLDEMGVPVMVVADEAAFRNERTRMVHQRSWIDAILGTGLSSDVRGYFKTVIEWINGTEQPVFAVDIASGLNADTGQVCGVCIEARATATFAFAKVGHLTYPGRALTGQLKIIEIGIPPHVVAEAGCRQHLITPGALKQAIPRRQKAAHKGDAGHALILAGAPGKTGAAAMAAASAMRAGAGLVTLGIPESLNPLLETMLTEVMTVGLAETPSQTLDESGFDQIVSLMARKGCLAVGPGIGTDATTGRMVNRLIDHSTIPMVIDADGLNLIAADPSILKKAKTAIVLTPHPGEMARLTGTPVAEIQKDRIGCARAFAQKYGVHLVLKGAATIVALPNGSVFINPTGNPGMAAGGMGDVLTGLIAGLIAQGMAADAAACSGVYVHGLAADRVACRKAAVGYLATEVMHAIPEAINELLTKDDNPPWPERDPLFSDAHAYRY